uniref:Putative ATP-dependent RNA helicase DHX57 n=1 Tax=Gouania willdenowi TaxID=441366 RepID=A0A8C5HLM0_GOUWI
PSRPAQNKQSTGRGGGRDASQDRDRRRQEKSGDKALPWSLTTSSRVVSKSGNAIPPEAGKLSLQKIFMTNENQEQLKELLRDLQKSDSDSSEGEEYDELDHREEGQFWATNDEPVGRAESPAYEPSDEERPSPEPIISLFAIGKLCRYGFDRERAKQALVSSRGEVGTTLELLLQQVFSERFGTKAVSPNGLAVVPMDECLSQRQEEAFALTAILGERFNDSIANTVWTISLDLPFLEDGAVKNKGSPGSGARQTAKKDICRFFLKGKGCRFGDECRFIHELPKSEADSLDLIGPSQPGVSNYTPLEYELVVRFPKGNRYPFQAPIVAFSTNDECVTAAARLSVTERLFGEALTAAKNSESVVYTLISLCEDEKTMKELLAVGHHKYSSPPPVVVIPPPAVVIPPPAVVIPSPAEIRETEEDKADVFENDSYISLRKKMVSKHNHKIANVLSENGKLCREFQRKLSSRRYMSMLVQRKNLPAWHERENILEMLDRSQVLVVSGMTGCGKTTQIPQFILDGSLMGSAGQVANIVCTQPRRISAISVAQRVAQERAESLGNSVGYQIRLESVKTSATRLLYCTTGVLLRRLEGEADLKGVTHVIVDEVHERTEESDFLLLVLKDLIVQRPDLKIILMSATLNADLFSDYFYNCPTIHIPGQTFPVDQFFLEDAIAETRYVCYSCLLDQCFSTTVPRHTSVPREIVRCAFFDKTGFHKTGFVKDSIPDQELNLQELCIRYKDAKKPVLKTLAAMDLDKINMDLVESLLEWIVEGKHKYPPGRNNICLHLCVMDAYCDCVIRCVVYPLHSTLSNEEQQAIFSRPPDGVTKIIISTNIAETSVTIDDVVYVIDSGKMKEKTYDASKCMESLEDSWVSRANALQRKGRAGRVASGVCFHLFTSHCFKHQLAEQQLPEIQRVPLEQLCLRIKILDLFAEQSLESVFSRLIEPPVLGSLDAASQQLQDLGALTADEKLTPLGYHLACLPVDVRIGKLMLFGAMFRCLDPALTIAASLAFKSPFVSPWDKREEANVKKRAFAVGNSDHLALLQAYKGWCSAAKNGKKAAHVYCRENFLSWRVLQEIASLKRQFAELLSDIGFCREGLRARAIERASTHDTDGVLEATGPEANLNSENISLMSAMLCAALYPNVLQVQTPQGNCKMTSHGEAKMQPKANELRFLTKSDGYVHVHPSSVNYTTRHYESPFLVYREKVKTSRVFIRDCSMVSVYPLLLFGCGQINLELHKGVFVFSLDDGWIQFAAPSHQVAELVRELRCELDRLLEDKIRNPNIDLYTCPRGSRIIQMIVHLITTQ